MPRLYISYLNRWTQPDTLIPQLDNPQSLNRYSYVLDRPINLNDPSGHDPWGCDNRPESCDTKYVADSLGRRGGHFHSFDGGWNDTNFSTWNLLRQGSPCAACHVTHDQPGDWGIPSNKNIDLKLVLYYRSKDDTAKFVHAYLFYTLGQIGSGFTTEVSAPPKNGETPDTIIGKNAHKDYPNMLGEDLDYNRQIKGYPLKPDAIDWENNIVRELKPDNARAIARGLNQLDQYVEALQAKTGEIWTGILDLYPK